MLFATTQDEYIKINVLFQMLNRIKFYQSQNITVLWAVIVNFSIKKFNVSS